LKFIFVNLSLLANILLSDGIVIIFSLKFFDSFISIAFFYYIIKKMIFFNLIKFMTYSQIFFLLWNKLNVLEHHFLSLQKDKPGTRWNTHHHCTRKGGGGKTEAQCSTMDKVCIALSLQVIFHLRDNIYYTRQARECSPYSMHQNKIK
jgi:hypothetical protein